MLTSSVYLQQGNVNKSQKIDEIANIDKEDLQISERLEELQWNFQENCVLK